MRALTGHQLGKVRVHLVEDDVDGLGVHLIELLLQETAAVLVLAHRIDLADHLVDARITSSCKNERFSMKPRFKSGTRRLRVPRVLVPMTKDCAFAAPLAPAPLGAPLPPV